jgi:hypothetical protein
MAVDAMAMSIARVLSKNWLDVAPLDQPLGIDVEGLNGDVVTYRAAVVPLN